jgi:hypothetical protein
MGDTHVMHVFHATHKLFEITICFCDFKFGGCEDESVEVAAGTIFHDFAVITFGVLEEIEGVNDVGMTKGGGDAEFRGKSFCVLFDSFLRTTTEFFDGVELFDGGIDGVWFMRYSYYSKSTYYQNCKKG